jgi:hypothetical protein
LFGAVELLFLRVVGAIPIAVAAAVTGIAVVFGSCAAIAGGALVVAARIVGLSVGFACWAATAIIVDVIVDNSVVEACEDFVSKLVG